MKKITKFIFTAFAAAWALMACSPNDNYSIGEYNLTQDNVSFDLTPGSDEFTYNFVVSFSVQPKCTYSCEINFGDNKSTKGSMGGSHEYIVYAGTYTATCMITLPTGDVLIKDKKITIAHDNPKALVDDPASLQFALTGGKANTTGKEWHIGAWSAMRNPDNRDEVWWDFKNDAVMNDVLTFVPNGIEPNGKYIYNNNGDTHMNEALGALFPDGNTAGSFVTTHYTPPTNATWVVSTSGGKTILTINNGFISYPASAAELTKSEYEVISYSPSNIRLVNISTWNGWCFELSNEAPSDPLTGTGSKTWVIDANNKHTDEVKAATGLNIKGFMGLGPLNSYNQEWWGAGPGEKSYDNTLSSVGHGWTLFDWKMTFSTGQYKIATAGEGYGRAALDGTGGFTSIWKNKDDMAFAFTGGNYTYTIANGDPYKKLTLSGNAFFGYYVGTQEYEILYLSNTALAVAAHNTAEGQDWVFILCPDGEQ